MSAFKFFIGFSDFCIKKNQFSQHTYNFKKFQKVKNFVCIHPSIIASKDKHNFNKKKNGKYRFPNIDNFTTKSIQNFGKKVRKLFDVVK